MRTKVLVCAAALAASLASSMAQNVYSLNVVGYYNVAVKGGGANTLCVNQLSTGTNGLNQIIPTAPYASFVLTFKNGDYNADVFDGTAWVDNNSGNPTETTLEPGKGFFFTSDAASPDATLTFVGEVPQGDVSQSFPAGLSMNGIKTPQSLDLAGNGFPQIFNSYILYFDNTLGDYVTYVNDGANGWFDNNSGDPKTLTPAVGQGWFWSYTDPTTWTRNFTVQ